MFESISKVIFSFNYKFKLEHINEIFFAEMYEKNMKKSSSDGNTKINLKISIKIKNSNTSWTDNVISLK